MNTETFSNCLQKIHKACAGLELPIVTLYARHKMTPFHVLIATIISARTKDETTARASERLFQRANTAEALFQLSIQEIAQLIYPSGFYRIKAQHIHKSCQILLKKHKGLVPNTLDALLELPGVGRKTANLVLSLSFNKASICVDTHVHRICNRLGFIHTKTPHETEKALRQRLDRKHWSSINTLLVAYGQNICRPISPRCHECALHKECQQRNIRKQAIPHNKSSTG